MRAAGLVVASFLCVGVFVLVAVVVCSVRVRADCMDVDGSGVLDAVDVQLVINGALSLPVEFDCDVDASGDINAVDVQKVINAVLGVSLPAVELSADPAESPPDYPVVFSSAVTGLCEAGATCTWDYGDGVVEEGLLTGLHAYAEEGDYAVKLTVSDGLSEATGQVTVHVAAAGGTSTSIGPEGGSVSLGKMSVEVPAGVLSETVPFNLSAFPAMKIGSRKALDPARFQPLGPAYRLDTPLRSAAAFTVTFSYDPAEIPDGFAVENLGYATRVVGWAESLDEESGASPGFEVRYPILPAKMDAKANAVTFETYMGGEFQLVAMAEPLDIVEFEAPGPTKSARRFAISVREQPNQVTEYKGAVVSGLVKAFNQFENILGFGAPAGTIHVEIDEMRADWAGFVSSSRPTTIVLNYTMTNPDQIAKNTAHEYFHVIQFYHTNPASLGRHFTEDLWFLEGTANWAMDEAESLDEIADRYDAPTAARFRTALNEHPPTGTNAYQTVAFWKYVEAKAAGESMIKAALVRQLLMTGVLSVAGNLIMNDDVVRYGDSFRAVHPNVPFLAFCRSALFYKDYAEDETRPGDLWDPKRLGPPNQLAPGLPETGKTHTLLREGAGDGTDNKLTVPFTLDERLTADVFVIKNASGEAALEGTLHVAFTPNASVGYQAGVIAYKGTTVVAEDVAVGFEKNSTTTAEVPFDPETEVAVIVVDPNWEDTPGAGTSECEVWVSGKENPCGELPEPIVDVDTIEALQEALQTPPEGGTIRLAPGLYYPSVQTYETLGPPEVATVDAYLMLDDVTLAGDPEAKPTIVMTGDPEVHFGIFVRGNATIRNVDLTGRYCSLFTSNVQSFDMCNVTMSTMEYWGVALKAWGSSDVRYTLTGCEISSSHPTAYAAIDIVTHDWDSATPKVRLVLEQNVIRDWAIGVSYEGKEDFPWAGTVIVETDCSDFVNCTQNVIEYTQSGPVEHCP